MDGRSRGWDGPRGAVGGVHWLGVHEMYYSRPAGIVIPCAATTARSPAACCPCFTGPAERRLTVNEFHPASSVCSLGNPANRSPGKGQDMKKPGEGRGGEGRGGEGGEDGRIHRRQRKHLFGGGLVHRWLASEYVPSRHSKPPGVAASIHLPTPPAQPAPAAATHPPGPAAPGSRPRRRQTGRGRCPPATHWPPSAQHKDTSSRTCGSNRVRRSAHRFHTSHAHAAVPSAPSARQWSARQSPRNICPRCCHHGRTPVLFMSACRSSLASFQSWQDTSRPQHLRVGNKPRAGCCEHHCTA